MSSMRCGRRCAARLWTLTIRAAATAAMLQATNRPCRQVQGCTCSCITVAQGCIIVHLNNLQASQRGSAMGTVEELPHEQETSDDGADTAIIVWRGQYAKRAIRLPADGLLHACCLRHLPLLEPDCNQQIIRLLCLLPCRKTRTQSRRRESRDPAPKLPACVGQGCVLQRGRRRKFISMTVTRSSSTGTGLKLIREPYSE